MTGTANQSELPEELASILEAARRGDIAKLGQSIDFGVTAMARLVHALWQIEPAARDCIAAQGLAELEAVEQRPELADATLSKVVPALTTARLITAADADTARGAIDALRGPEPPPDLSPQLLPRIAVVRERASSAERVYAVLAASEEPLLIAVLANQRVAICPS